MLPVPSGVVDSNTPAEHSHLTNGEAGEAVSKWFAEGRVDDAARDRARRRWLERQAAEDASLIGTLVELGEHGGPVLLHTVGGAMLSGPILAVGVDVVVVQPAGGGEAYVPVHAVSTVRATDEAAARGDRSPAVALTFNELLVELAADTPDVSVRVTGQELTGRLRSVGSDVATVAVGGGRADVAATPVHINPTAIDHIIIWSR